MIEMKKGSIANKLKKFLSVWMPFCSRLQCWTALYEDWDLNTSWSEKIEPDGGFLWRIHRGALTEKCAKDFHLPGQCLHLHFLSKPSLIWHSFEARITQDTIAVSKRGRPFHRGTPSPRNPSQLKDGERKFAAVTQPSLPFYHQTHPFQKMLCCSHNQASCVYWRNSLDKTISHH